MAKNIVHHCSNPKLHGDVGYADGGPVYDRLNYADLPLGQMYKGTYSDSPGGSRNTALDEPPQAPDHMAHAPPQSLDNNQYPSSQSYTEGRVKSTRRKM